MLSLPLLTERQKYFGILNIIYFVIFVTYNGDAGSNVNLRCFIMWTLTFLYCLLNHL